MPLSIVARAFDRLHAYELLRAGADKVSINSAAVSGRSDVRQKAESSVSVGFMFRALSEC